MISPAAARPSGIRPALIAYLESYYGPGDALPVAMLVQFDRTSGRYDVTFEDTDSSRWKVTPANLKEIFEELRPSLA